MPKFSFQNPPPVKTKEISIPEWDPEGKFIITELLGTQYQEVVDLFNGVSVDEMTRRAIEGYATLLAMCLSYEDGTKPTKEWLVLAGGATLKRIGDEALAFNGFQQEATEQLEKN